MYEILYSYHVSHVHSYLNHMKVSQVFEFSDTYWGMNYELI